VIWATPMLIAAGLFAGGAVSIAWERIPAWRGADLESFQTAFAHTLRRVDPLQPALVVISLISTIGFALSEEDGARVVASLSAAGFLIVLVGSGALLVPIQRRLVASGPDGASPELERLRARWLRGHVLRTVVGLASFVLAVVAAVL
jgi:Anthrone oxygenase